METLRDQIGVLFLLLHSCPPFSIPVGRNIVYVAELEYIRRSLPERQKIAYCKNIIRTYW